LFLASLCHGDQSVTITKVDPGGKCGSYYEVTLDFGGDDSYQAHYTMGQKYAQAILETYHDGDYEQSISAYFRYYVAYFNLNGLFYKDFMSRVSDLIEKFDSPDDEFYLYGAEIKGMASVIDSRENGYAFWDILTFFLLPENQLSFKELFLVNMISDVFSNTGCTSVSAWGSLTPDEDPAVKGCPIVGKNTDFPVGLTLEGELGKISSMHAVHYFKNQGSKKDMISIGFLGCLLLSEKGVNEDGLFLAENITPYITGDDYYESKGKDSISGVMRHCLENFHSADESAGYFLDGKSFTHGNVVTLVDPSEAKLVENSYLGSYIREYDSTLRSGPTGIITNEDTTPPEEWDYQKFSGPVLAATNSFQLPDQPYNHINTSKYRISTIESMVMAMDNDGVLTEDELMEIMSQGERLGGQDNIFRTDLSSTLQSTIYNSGKRTIKIHFAPCPFVVKKPDIPDYIDLNIGFIGEP